MAVVLAAGALWRFAGETPADQAFEMAGELLAAHLAPADAGLAAQQQAIDRLHTRFGIDLGLFADDRRPLAAAGSAVPAPPTRRESGGWISAEVVRLGSFDCRTRAGSWQDPHRDSAAPLRA